MEKALAAILVATFLICSFNISHDNLDLKGWYLDEGKYFQLAANVARDNTLAFKRLDTYVYDIFSTTPGVMSMIIGGLFMKLAGTGIVQLRLLTVITFLFSIIIMHDTIKRVFNSRTAIVSTAIFALSPRVFWISRIFFADTFFLFFFLLSINLYVRKKINLCALSTAACILTKHYGALLFGAVLISLLVEKNYKDLPKFITVSLIPICLFFGWGYFREPTFFDQMKMLFGSWSNLARWEYRIQVLVGSRLFLGIFAIGAIISKEKLKQVPPIFWSWIFVFSAWFLTAFARIKYFIPIFPPLLAIGVYGIDSYLRTHKKYKNYATVIFVLIMVSNIFHSTNLAFEFNDNSFLELKDAIPSGTGYTPFAEVSAAYEVQLLPYHWQQSTSLFNLPALTRYAPENNLTLFLSKNRPDFIVMRGNPPKSIGDVTGWTPYYECALWCATEASQVTTIGSYYVCQS